MVLTNSYEVIKLSQMQINRICDFYLAAYPLVVKTENATSEDFY